MESGDGMDNKRQAQAPQGKGVKKMMNEDEVRRGSVSVNGGEDGNGGWALLQVT